MAKSRDLHVQQARAKVIFNINIVITVPKEEEQSLFFFSMQN